MQNRKNLMSNFVPEDVPEHAGKEHGIGMKMA